MIRAGRKRVKSVRSMLRGLSLYLGLLLRAGAILGFGTTHAHAQAALPVPCAGGACVANGGPAVWISSGRVQAPTITGSTMNIVQQSNTATLNWASFDVGAGASVNFSQPSNSAVALNRIYQNDPSQIDGAIHANGQIYLINQNGIVFGSGAQVDVHGLVASTLNISDQVFSFGIAQAINQPTPVAAFSGSGPMGDITVSPGAVIKTDDGGQVMIFAPNITNGGSITTPQGQTLLAASQDKVYLKVNSPSDPGLRGFLVEVGTGGNVTNNGTIAVGNGNATLMGRVINQNGMAAATTSVQLNGSIYLLARDQVNTGLLTNYRDGLVQQLATRGGNVTLGPNSVTEVLPDTSDNSTAVDSQGQQTSTVKIMAKTIDMQTASKVVAPGGKVTLTATVNPSNVSATNLAANDSRILMEAESLIDVSGTTSAVLPMSSNVVQIQLRGNELADSPLQRNSVLYGQTVSVDVNQGTHLANVSGAIANVRRSVDQRLAAGGTVTASSEGDVILSKGSTVNFSGGKVTYQSGYLNTTKLITANGNFVDIGNADPNQLYTAILGGFQYTDPKWGVTQSWQSPVASALSTYQPGYVQGMDAGTFSVQAPSMVLDGVLRGGATSGTNQRLPPTPLANTQPTWARPFDEVPVGGQLILGDPIGVSRTIADFRAPSIAFEVQATPGQAITIDEPLPAGEPLQLPEDIFTSSGITRAALYSNGNITIPGDVSLSMSPGGSLTLVAGSSSPPLTPEAAILPSLALDGNITIPGGTVVLASQATRAIGADRKNYQTVAIGSGTRIDTSGMWVNDTSLQNPAGATSPEFINGGSVSIRSSGDLVLNRGSLIDVSGGAQLFANGAVAGGNGGSVSLSSSGDEITTLQLEGDLRGYSLGKGGALAITADGIRIQDPASIDQAPAGELVLHPDFFQNGGFASYNLEATALGLSVADNTQLNLIAQNRVLDSGFQNQATGSDISQFSHVATLPEPQRTPVDFTLVAEGLGLSADPNESLTMGAGATIQTDPLGAVSLRTDRLLAVSGAIDAPAGNISLQLDNNISGSPFFADKGIWLMPGSQLSASGVVQLLPNDFGRSEGKVLPAGTVNLNARDGFLVTEAGSSIDVSGTFHTLNVLTDSGSGSSYVATNVSGAAGSIQLQATDGMYLDGSLIGKSAAAGGAAGGTLSISLDTVVHSDDSVFGGGSLYYPKGPHIIEVSAAAGPSLPSGINPGDSPFSQALLSQLADGRHNSVAAVAYVSAPALEQGGFDAIDLSSGPVLINQGNQIQPNSSAVIDFSGNVSLQAARQISLDAFVFATQDGQVKLDAPYVALGSTNTDAQMSAPPSAGAGSLTVNADFIDLIGNGSLQGFGANNVPAVELRASDDIRLQGVRLALTSNISGSFNAAGDMTLQAGQVYPTTLSQFTLSIQNDPQGTITFAGGNAAKAPLSADGKMIVSAPNIVQGGILRAPFGQIELNGSDALQLKEGSVTSVSGDGLLIPFGQTQFGQDWVMQYEPALLSVVNGPQGALYTLPLPDKKVTLNAPSVKFANGAVIDVSGGGDLYGTEFVPGPGGSTDILLPQNAGGSFAVLPYLGSLYAPIDPTIASLGAGVGETVFLGAANGLPAGEYAMLPARYALLPGAYLVTPLTGTTGMSPGQAYSQLSGIPIVAGQRRVANTDIAGSLWSGYAVANGAQLRQQAQYAESYVGTFFKAATAPQLPQDAGEVTINAVTSLDLGGHIDGQSPDGRSSQVNITGQDISVVSQLNAGGTGIQIVGSDLNALGATSLLLGGTRQVTAAGTALNATAQSITIGPGVNLQVPELILTAASASDGQGGIRAGEINVESGAMLDGSGNLPGAETALLLNGDSALLRIASGGTPAVQRNNVPAAPVAQLNIAAGAQLVAGNLDAHGTLQSGSLTLDSTGNATSTGTIQIGNGGALSLGASRISVGEVANANINQGLVLSNDELAHLNVSELSLISSSGIDFYGDTALNVTNLTLEAQALNGRAAAGQSANLKADTLNLIGNPTAQNPGEGNGAGILNIKAQTVNIGSVGATPGGGSENLALTGFDEVDLTADTVAFRNAGTFTVPAAANVNAGEITGASGSNWSVSAGGALNIGANPSPTSAARSDASDLGGVLSITGQQVSLNTSVVLPSGSLSLTANGSGPGGDVVVGSQGVIDVSGRTVTFTNTAKSSPGGSVALSSQTGDIDVQAGSKIDLAGGSDTAGAGSLGLSAPRGTVTIAGELVASQTQDADAQGSFSLDTANVTNFSALIALLARNGFTGQVDIRARNGDLGVGVADEIKARDVTLTADNGNIDISGLIDASGAAGGRVNVNAGDNLDVSSTAQILARGTGDNVKGGSVQLGTTQGVIGVAPGAVIDVTGTKLLDLQVQQQDIVNGQPIQTTVSRTGSGTVDIRIPRAALASSDLSGVASGVVGAGSTIVEAYQDYTDDAGTLGSNAANASAGNPYYQDAVSFMQNEPTIMAGLGLANDANVQLRPGVEIDSAGPLTVTAPFDLSQWRFGPHAAPGILTIRSAGNLTVNQQISDGFDEGVTDPGSGVTTDKLRQDDSWSLRMVAGADLASANPLAVAPATGNLFVGNGVVVRSGSGGIDIAAGGNMVMGNAGSVIYTAGLNGGFGTYDPFTASALLNGQFPVGGGNLNITVDGNINGVANKQLFSDWLPRLGGPSDFGNLPTTWAINFGNFQQGIGALGGGNVQVTAGGNIGDLSVVMPTIGIQTGQAIYDLENTGTVTTLTNEVSVAGGDRLSVRAGGNILGGVYYAGQGEGQIRAGGVIGQSNQNSLYPILALGNSQFNVSAAGNVGIETALNPTVLLQDSSQSPPELGLSTERSYFFTYGAASAVNLTSIFGTILLDNNGNLMNSYFPGAGANQTAQFVYPGSLSASALQGDIKLGQQGFILFPSANGELALLASGSVTVGNSQVAISLSDTDPVTLPSIAQPVSDLSASVTNLNPSADLPSMHAPVPVHQGDTNPALIEALNGSIGSSVGSNGQILLKISKPVEMIAAQDIRNTAVTAQNLSVSDESIIQAGGNITFNTLRLPNGLFDPTSPLKIRIDGPGYADILAGSNVDLGTSIGISSQGNLQNPVLAPQGADLLIAAGLGDKPDYNAFVTRYLSDSTAYQGQLEKFLSKYPATDTGASDMARFQSLPSAAQHRFIFEVFFNELQQSGTAAAGSINKDYSSGFDAISTLFPGSVGSGKAILGNLNMLLSQISTLDGGNITLVVPQGVVNAGVTNTSVVNKDPGKLGIVVQGTGNMDAYVRGDFTVNQSRVFTLDGGDILIWSSLGSIDAGRGAKTAIFAPGVQTSIDPTTGAVTLVFPPAIAGSGIAAAVTTPDTPPGNVYLFAPQGIVNAGDAGIRSQGNVTIAAAEVKGADNISVGGVAVGVPVVNTGSLAAGLTGISNVASTVSKSTEESVNNAAANQASSTPLADAALTYLDVVVFGLGDQSVGNDPLSGTPIGN